MKVLSINKSFIKNMKSFKYKLHFLSCRVCFPAESDTVFDFVLASCNAKKQKADCKS
jgi:hypothetical protein